MGLGFITASIPIAIFGPEDDSYDFDLAYMPLTNKYAALFSADALLKPFAQLDFSRADLMNRSFLFNCKGWDVAMSRGSGPLELAIRG